ncbi:unknown [Bacteroides sp. CAG:598]|nr:unknown [Bacteroides sp. CAG:598]
MVHRVERDGRSYMHSQFQLVYTQVNLFFFIAFVGIYRFGGQFHPSFGIAIFRIGEVEPGSVQPEFQHVEQRLLMQVEGTSCPDRESEIAFPVQAGYVLVGQRLVQVAEVEVSAPVVPDGFLAFLFFVKLVGVVVVRRRQQRVFVAFQIVGRYVLCTNRLWAGPCKGQRKNTS